MKTIDAATMIKKMEEKSRSDKEWLDEHDGEFDDLVYEESVGQKESWASGSMVGSPNVFKP